jgi:hypothetical protein
MALVFATLFLSFLVPANSKAEYEGRCSAVKNQRELSSEDYEALGRMVWSRMEMYSDPAKRELSADEVNELIDRMHRNRDEVQLDLGTLNKLMRSPSLCTGGKDAPGIDLDELL